MATQTGSAVIVAVDIKEDRVGDFLKAMEIDVAGSRNRALDPGCLRFDLLKSRQEPNRFFFYECYVDDDAAAFHKTTAHYKAWADFKASGGVVNQEVMKLETTSFPGRWALQPNNEPHPRAHCALIVTVDIKPDRIDDFLRAMQVDAIGSRNKAADPGCLRFDLLHSRESPNKFVFYEIYTNDDATVIHKETQHFKAWADFKATGGVENQVVVKAECASIGPWALQTASVQLGSTDMPLLGFGTYKVGVVPASSSSAAAGAAPMPQGPEVCDQIIRDAIGQGYAMFDCAQFYMNERWVGDAWKKTAMPRESLFFTSKVWNNVIYEGPEAVKAQVRKSVEDLQCGAIDLYLVHWPVPGKHVAAYNALRECKAAGLIKEIGISNYCIEDYQELRAAGAFGEGDRDKPVCNQLEVNPLLYRRRTLDFFRGEGVHIQAYRGLMNGPTAWQLPQLQEICQEVGRSPTQVLGRFLLQQGISHVPKASAPARMAENADVFTFELSGPQMERLASLTTPQALEAFKALYSKCIWRDTPQAGDPCPGERTLD